MARVLALIPDLLFGSRVQAMLQGAGHEVELIAEPSRLQGRLEQGPQSEVLVVDLTDEDLDGAGLVRSLAAEGRLVDTRTLGFFSHVDTQARERAERAGFDMVVPRSRMAREGAELMARLIGQAPPAVR